jgi:hypothetical protein
MACCLDELTHEIIKSHRPLSKDLADKAEKKLTELENQYQELASVEKFKSKPFTSKLIWVGVDLDGTLAEPLWTPDNPTSDIGDPIPDAILKVNQLVAQGYKVIVHTSRPWTDYQVIEQWLQHYNIPFKEIQCGKPLYAAYIDDRAINAEEESWLPSH